MLVNPLKYLEASQMTDDTSLDLRPDVKAQLKFV